MEKNMEKIVTRELRRKFPRKTSSWIRRAIARFRGNSVSQLNENTWIVKGNPRLGDKYPNYIVRFKDGRYYCTCFESSWGSRRENDVCTHVAAVILYREYSRLMEPIYAAVISMECLGDYYLDVLDSEVNVIKQVKTLSNNIKPKYRITYIITSNNPKTTKIRYVCNEEIKEEEVVLSLTKKYMIEAIRDQASYE